MVTAGPPSYSAPTMTLAVSGIEVAVRSGAEDPAEELPVHVVMCATVRNGAGGALSCSVQQ